MNIKRFKAKDIKDAVALVKTQLGENAVILSTRKVPDGIEVLAAKDVDIKLPTPNSQLPTPNSQLLTPNSLSSIKDIENHLVEMKKDMRNIFDLIQLSSPLPTDSSLYSKLISNGMLPSNAMKITSELEPECKGVQLNAPTIDDLKAKLSSRIHTAPIHLPADKKPVIVSFIGPTGVGKTTTIAKLASNFTIYDKLKVALITIDTYRIAAVDQLKTFADIINIPLAIVYSPDEFAFSIHEHENYDVLFIDTAGRSQRNKKHMKELLSFFKMVKPDEIHLVLSMTTKTEVMLDIIENFEIASPDKLVFTKLDETTKFGGILDVLISSGKPISYLTNGQNVPDDIERADPMKIAEYILGTKNAQS